MQRKSCVRADLAPLRETLRDLLKFVQEVARFVTSRSFKKKSLGGSEKSLRWQHFAHLYYSPLSLSDCSTSIFKRNLHTRTGVSGSRPIRGGGGGSAFTISDWFRPWYWPNVCLLLNHRETFFFSRTAGRTGATSDFWVGFGLIFAPLRN